MASSSQNKRETSYIATLQFYRLFYNLNQIPCNRNLQPQYGTGLKTISQIIPFPKANSRILRKINIKPMGHMNCCLMKCHIGFYHNLYNLVYN